MSLLEISKKYREPAVIDCCLPYGRASKHADARINEVCVVLGKSLRSDAIQLGQTVGKEGTVYLIDPEDYSSKNESLAEVKKFYNICVLKSSFERINLGDGTADLVIANCTIHRSVWKQEIWHEIYRILKKVVVLWLQTIIPLILFLKLLKADPCLTMNILIILIMQDSLPLQFWRNQTSL